MTKFTTIKAGYRLTVTSWENDADNYNTKMIEGLTKEDVEFHVKFISLFKSGSRGGFGNMHEPSSMKRYQLAEAIALLVQANDATNTSFDGLGKLLKDVDVTDEEKFEDDIMAPILDSAHDYLWELGLTGGEFYTRVLDKYKVEFVPHDIQIQDVTDQFQ